MIQGRAFSPKWYTVSHAKVGTRVSGQFPNVQDFGLVLHFYGGALGAIGGDKRDISRGARPPPPFKRQLQQLHYYVPYTLSLCVRLH